MCKLTNFFVVEAHLYLHCHFFFSGVKQASNAVSISFLFFSFPNLPHLWLFCSHCSLSLERCFIFTWLNFLSLLLNLLSILPWLLSILKRWFFPIFWFFSLINLLHLRNSGSHCCYTTSVFISVLYLKRYFFVGGAQCFIFSPVAFVELKANPKPCFLQSFSSFYWSFFGLYVGTAAFILSSVKFLSSNYFCQIQNIFFCFYFYLPWRTF